MHIYYETIGGPDKACDLFTMRKKTQADAYTSTKEFLIDAEKIHLAALAYNGPSSSYAITSKEIFKI